MLITIRVPENTVKINYELADPNEDYMVSHPVTMGMIMKVEPEEPAKEDKE